MFCKNCGAEFEGKFCSQCGQKNIEGRFTIKELLHNFFHTLTHVDSGILYLAKELFIRPGIVAKEYIEGKRKKYYNPLQYLILTVAISTFITVNYNILGPKATPEALSNPNDYQRFFSSLNEFFYKYINVVLFLSVPLSAFFSRLFFRKSGYNFAENLIFNSFIAAQRTLVFIILSVFIYFLKDMYLIFIGIYYLFWLVYFTFAFVQFFGENIYKTILKFIAMFVIMLVIGQSLAMLIVYIFFFK